MSTIDFSTQCKVCRRGVDSLSQTIRYILTESGAVQEQVTMLLSCGCVIDFPDWQIDVTTGLCKIFNFAAIQYLEFYDDDMILEEDD